jgi:hypothetical protein
LMDKTWAEALRPSQAGPRFDLRGQHDLNGQKMDVFSARAGFRFRFKKRVISRRLAHLAHCRLLIRW